MNRSVLITSIFVVSIILDQWTKYIARKNLVGAYFSYWADTVRIFLAENSGAFLSLGSTLSETARFIIFVLGIGIMMLIGLVMLYRKKDLDQISTIAYSLVLSGGVSNLIDRGMKGSVTDFINIGIGELRTGVFNVADMAIMVGVGLLFYMSFRHSKDT